MIIAAIAFVTGSVLFAAGMLGNRLVPFSGFSELPHSRRILLGLAGLLLILLGVFRASSAQFCITLVPEPAKLSPTRQPHTPKAPVALGRGILRWTKNTFSFGSGKVDFLPDECQVAVYPGRTTTPTGFGMTQRLDCRRYQQLRVTVAYPDSMQPEISPGLFTLKLNNKPKIGTLIEQDILDPVRHRMRTTTYAFKLDGLKSIHKLEIAVPPGTGELVFTELRFH